MFLSRGVMFVRGVLFSVVFDNAGKSDGFVLIMPSAKKLKFPKPEKSLANHAKGPRAALSRRRGGR